MKTWAKMLVLNSFSTYRAAAVHLLAKEVTSLARQGTCPFQKALGGAEEDWVAAESHAITAQ